MLRIGMMTETIYKYTGMKGALKMIKDLGFECADITFGVERQAKVMIPYFSGKDYKKRAQELKKYADQIKLPLVQAHAPFPSMLTGNNRFNRTMFQKLIKSIEICGILKIKYLIIHPWHDYDLKTNVAFYKRLLPYAKKANVVICVENMYRWNKETNKVKPCFSTFADTFNAVIDKMNSKYIKACVDIGHAEMLRELNYSAYKLLTHMNNRVVCLHIHDNDLFKDRHQIPFQGKINYKDVIKGLKKINYKGDLISEIGVPPEINTLAGRLQYWKKNYQAMKKFKGMMR